MTNVMEMKRSSLVLTTSGYELGREKMSYVDGGGKIKFSVTAKTIGTIAGVLATGGTGAVLEFLF